MFDELNSSLESAHGALIESMPFDPDLLFHFETRGVDTPSPPRPTPARMPARRSPAACARPAPRVPPQPDGSAAETLESLVEAMGQGSERALNRLHPLCTSRLRACATAIVRRHELADEVVSASFEQAWRTARSFDRTRGSAIAWLLIITRSRAFDALRAERSRKAYEVAAHDEELEAAPAAENASPDRVLQSLQTSSAVHSLLKGLACTPRQALCLSFLKGLSHEEIAVHLQMPLGTVKSHIQRGLKTLVARCIASGLAL